MAEVGNIVHDFDERFVAQLERRNGRYDLEIL